MLSVRRQCELLELNRSSWYYQSLGESDFNLMPMKELDEQYTRTPFYGVCKMTEYLHPLGHQVNEKRVRRLLRQMGLDGVLSQAQSQQQTPGSQGVSLSS